MHVRVMYVCHKTNLQITNDNLQFTIFHNSFVRRFITQNRRKFGHNNNRSIAQYLQFCLVYTRSWTQQIYNKDKLTGCLHEPDYTRLLVSFANNCGLKTRAKIKLKE